MNSRNSPSIYDSKNNNTNKKKLEMNKVSPLQEVKWTDMIHTSKTHEFQQWISQTRSKYEKCTWDLKWTRFLPFNKSNDHTWYTHQRLMYFNNEYPKYAKYTWDLKWQIHWNCLTQSKANCSIQPTLVCCVCKPSKKWSFTTMRFWQVSQIKVKPRA